VLLDICYRGSDAFFSFNMISAKYSSVIKYLSYINKEKCLKYYMFFTILMLQSYRLYQAISDLESYKHSANVDI